MLIEIRRIAIISSEGVLDADSFADSTRRRGASTGGNDVREIGAAKIGALVDVFSFLHRCRAHADADSALILVAVAPRAGLSRLLADILLQEGAVASLLRRVERSIVRDAEIDGEGRIVEVGDVLGAAPEARAGDIARRFVPREGAVACGILRDADALLDLIAEVAHSVYRRTHPGRATPDGRERIAGELSARRRCAGIDARTDGVAECASMFRIYAFLPVRDEVAAGKRE